MKYIVKNSILLIVAWKESSWSFQKEMNDICMGIVLNLVKKNVGRRRRWNIEEGLFLILKMCQMCQMKGGLIWNVPKFRLNCFISLIKVN